MAGQRVIAPLLATLLLVGTVSAQDCSDACSGMVISTSTVKTHYCIDRIEMILKLEAEGGYGPTLQAAVLKFQRNNGLPADGVVGPSTWTALLKACNASQAPACTPSNVQLPAWSGGTTEELACAVKSLAISMGLKEQQQWAYIMATANWESISTFAPVREGGEDKSEEWRSTKLGRYYPYYGRGYVPLTWHHNYKKYSNLLGGDCNLVSIPDLALRPEIALYVLVHGMSTGAFTGAKLATYVNASKVDYVGARRVTKLPLQGLKGFDAPEMVALSAEVWNNSYNSEICIGL